MTSVPAMTKTDLTPSQALSLTKAKILTVHNRHLGIQPYMFEQEPKNAVERPNNDESAVNDIEHRSRNLEW